MCNVVTSEVSRESKNYLIINKFSSVFLSLCFAYICDACASYCHVEKELY